MKKKKGNKVLLVLLIILAISLIPLINFHLIVYNENLYKNEFAKLNIYDNFEDKKYPDGALSGILDYFKNENNEIPQIEDFNEMENSHMRDVKLLINRVILFEIFLIFLWIILFLIFIVKKDLIYQFSRIIFYSGGSLIILILFFMTISIFAFDFAFIIFHKIFFIQGNWAFPSNSNMIQLFPSQFFQDIFLKIIINTGISAVLFFIIGFLIMRVGKIKNNS